MEKAVREVKKGDVVFLAERGGVIGEVVSYDKSSKTIVLTWPTINGDNPFWGGANPQSFTPVTDNDFRVLTANEVFKEMTILIEKYKQRLAWKIKYSIEIALSQIKIINN